jgi:hypothetical protein
VVPAKNGLNKRHPEAGGSLLAFLALAGAIVIAWFMPRAVYGP